MKKSLKSVIKHAHHLSMQNNAFCILYYCLRFLFYHVALLTRLNNAANDAKYR